MNQEVKALDGEKYIFKLIDLVNLTKSKEWNHDELNKNKNIYLEDIEANIIPISNNEINPFSKWYLSSNPNLTLDFVIKYNKVIKYEKSSWDWHELSWKFSLNQILAHPELPWNYHEVIIKNCIKNFKFIQRFSDFEWDYNILSEYINIKFILSNPQYLWNPQIVSSNRTVTMEIIKANPQYPWNFDNLSIFIPLKDIIANPQYPWDFNNLSMNTSLTSEYVIINLNEDWEWYEIGVNKNINLLPFSEIKVPDEVAFMSGVLETSHSHKIELILKHLDTFNHVDSDIIRGFYQNGLDLNIIKEYPELIRDYDELSIISLLTLDYVLEHIDEKWNMFELSRNKSFNMNDILRGFENGINWDFRGLSLNPNITFDFIYQNRDKNWDWNSLSGNDYTFEYKRRKYALKLERNYYRKKVVNVLSQYMLKDLNKMVMEY